VVAYYLQIGIVEISQYNLMQSRVRIGTLEDYRLYPIAKNILDLLIQGIKQLASPVFMEQKKAIQKEPFQRREAGKPHKPDDLWAYNEIHEKGREPAIVEKEWLEREGVINRCLVDPGRQFVRLKKKGWL
jgi:hypothetical protein